MTTQAITNSAINYALSQHSVPTPREIEQRLARLTNEEREYLHLLATGVAIDEISARMQLNRQSAEMLQARVTYKMRAPNPATLVSMLSAASRQVATRAGTGCSGFA